MSRNALFCSLIAGALTALAVAGHRVGLGLSLALLAVIATGVLSARRRVDRLLLVLAVALALQPTLRDAGWVVTASVVAALAGAAASLVGPRRWPALGRAVLAPVRVAFGLGVVAEGARTHAPALSRSRWAAVGRGAILAAPLVAGFGALFAGADPAFADATGSVLDIGGDPEDLTRRALLGVAACGVAGTLAGTAGTSRAIGARVRPLILVGRTELVVVVGALVGLFATFVVVQLPILFGGDAHVRTTAGLGYGDHARHGFVLLLVVAGLTLAVVGLAARNRDATVRGLLGALCVLTLVVLWSAGLRIGLVTDAYGLTRVRYGGQAVVVWLAAVFLVVLAAGARPAVAARAPRLVVLLSLAGVLAFSLTNPDGRIAASIVARSAAGEPVDREYAQGLSADALHRLWEIPRRDGGAVLWGPVERRLERPDGLAGFNVGRWTAR